MFFYLSKIFWLLAQPVSLAAILIGLSLGAVVLSMRRASTMFGALALIILGLSIWTNAGALALQPLENRFPKPARYPERVDGIIVLGGAFEGRVSKGRAQPELNEGGDRLTEAVALALRYPGARVLISGGSGSMTSEIPGDADLAPEFMQRLGIAPERLITEGGSRNTQENAAYSRQVANPKPGEVWLLVTSAFHMPRSVGLFRKVGWDLVPWPSDYRTAGDESFGLCSDDLMRCLRQASTATREWIGLIAYRLTGRIDEAFPSP